MGKVGKSVQTSFRTDALAHKILGTTGKDKGQDKRVAVELTTIIAKFYCYNASHF